MTDQINPDFELNPDETTSLDAADGSVDGLEETDPVEVADIEQPYTEATADTLSTNDLIADGADPAAMTPDEDAVPVDEMVNDVDPNAPETIEDRLAQEEPDVI